METKKQIICGKCKKLVSYHIFTKEANITIKDIEIKYEEQYGICDECESEIFVPGLDDRNEKIIEQKYWYEKGKIDAGKPVVSDEEPLKSYRASGMSLVEGKWQSCGWTIQAHSFTEASSIAENDKTFRIHSLTDGVMY